MTEMNYSDGDKVVIKAAGIPLTYQRKGGAWHLMVLTDFYVDAYIKAGKGELL